MQYVQQDLAQILNAVLDIETSSDEEPHQSVSRGLSSVLNEGVSQDLHVALALIQLLLQLLELPPLSLIHLVHGISMRNSISLVQDAA